MAKRKAIVYRKLATPLAENVESLPAITSLEGWRVETWYALVVDSDSDRYSSNDQLHKRAFIDAEVAKDATMYLKGFQSMWGQKGQMYPVLVLTKNGKTGYMIHLEPLKLMVNTGVSGKIALAKTKVARGIKKQV
jgi:hypothetical protein